MWVSFQVPKGPHMRPHLQGGAVAWILMRDSSLFRSLGVIFGIQMQETSYFHIQSLGHSTLSPQKPHMSVRVKPSLAPV